MSFSITKDVGKDDVVLAIIKGGKLNGHYLTVRTEGLGKKNCQLKDGEFIPILSRNGINAVYLAGPRKSGKTTLMCKILNQANKDIYLFSRLGEGEDDSLCLDTDNDVERVDINQLLDYPMDWRELEGRIVVLDDAETAPDPRVNKAVQILADQILESGRRHIPAIIRTGHFLLNSKQTRQGLLESNFIVFFHRSGGLTYQIIRFLKEHAGLNKHQIEQVMAIPGRWVGFFRDAPNLFMGERNLLMF